jgi:hypothetical protein
VQRWNRTLRLNRSSNEVELLDEYVLQQPAKTISLTFMTPCTVKVGTPGELSLAMPDGKNVRIQYDAHALAPGVEEIRLDDAHLRQSWGERLFRILLRAQEPPLRASWRTRIIG